MSLLHRPFRRVGIVNRGEPAVRFLRAARSWSKRRREPLEVVALYTNPDRDSLFAREADHAVALGDALVPAPGGGLRSAYLDVDRILRLLQEAGCDAVWPGWGFVSERPDFADECAKRGIVFIGPSGESMRLLGDKIAGKLAAEKCGVPVTPWSGGPVKDAADAAAHAQRIGLPVLLKAAAGGGGRGIRIIREMSELAPSFTSACNEARSAFGDDTILVEAFAPEARHVEVQVIADSHGRVHAVGTRDCSMQRRHQKVLEEAPAPGLGALEQKLKDAAVAVAKASKYVNAGTAEFLVLPDLSGFYFLEMNTRLQVEHPVTESVTGLDLVGMQIDVARGESLPEKLPENRGHSIEARLNAEDPDENFRPSAGRIFRFELASGPGVRVDSGFVAGDVVPGEFDSMLAKVIATGATREDALARLEEALARSVVAIEGGASNRSLLLELVANETFRAHKVTTRWLDRHLGERPKPLSRRHLDGALVAAAIGEYLRAEQDAVDELMRKVHRGLPPSVPTPEVRSFRFAVGGTPIPVDVLATAPEKFRVRSGDRWVDVAYQSTGSGTALLTMGGHRLSILQVVTPTALHVEVDGVAHRLSKASDGRVAAPVPAAVTEVCVKEGATVALGDRLFTLEVMKMEVPVPSPVAGKVARLLVEPASRVTAGQALAIIESAGAGESTEASTEAVSPFAHVPASQPRLGSIFLSAMLGYDFPAKEIEAAIGQLQSGKASVGVSDLMVLLEAYLAHEYLFVTAPASDGVAPVDRLATYLRRRNGLVEDLPAPFVAELRAALGWHDVKSLDASPEQDRALLRILQAHRALEIREEILLELLAALTRDESVTAAEADRARLHELLEALSSMAARRDRELAEAAYAALYVWSDRPRQAAEADRLGRIAAEAFAALVSTKDPAKVAEFDTRLDQLPNGALLSLIASTLGADPARRSALLDRLVRRLHSGAVARKTMQPALPVVAYSVGKTPLAGLLVEASWLVEKMKSLVEAIAAEGVTEVDAFVSEPDDKLLARIEGDLASSLGALPKAVTRFSVNWGNVEFGRLSRTFMRGADGKFAEDLFLRDFHPARVEARELQTLREFDLERVPAPGEVFLAIARAKADKADERLVCIVESEHVDIERDPTTRELVRIPSFERVYLTALHAMRAAHNFHLREPKPFWNRLIVFVRPLLDLTLAEVAGYTRRLAPATAGLGLEKMIVRGRMVDASMPQGRPIQFEFTNPTGHGATLRATDPEDTPISPATGDERRGIEARRKRLFYPYELIRALSRTDNSGPFPRGTFTELELAKDGVTLSPAERPLGQNTANIVVGVVSNHFAPYNEGLRRVLLVGDPTRGMGSLAEPECRRIIAALDLAEREKLSVEWVAVSSGARIAMDSGTENLDWTARVLARIVRFTQDGGTINVVVDGVNVGAQSYWNAEATMLMHCRGALIMTPQGSMLLTGKRALEYAGSVSAEDNNGIGGFERVMGPNGQAQYFANDLTGAYKLLFRHLSFTSVQPGESRPRRLPSADPVARDITQAPYVEAGATEGWKTVGEIFDEMSNPGRKRAFGIRPVLRSVLDQDIEPLERWAAWQGAESAVVWEGSLGGDPICCIGIESRPIPRRGEAPSDGPDHWTSGTLFPLSSKKVARAINAASGVRPVVVLANLSGFDGSPDSLRNLQLEYGAEIGRAVVNFQGTLVFCVVSRYHGGAYVVFSRALHGGLQAMALEGSFASVIGGGPAAAVVFPGLVRKRADADPAVVAARKALESASMSARATAVTAFERSHKEALARAQAAVAKEFDTIHSVERAYKVGSLEAVIDPRKLRPLLIERIRGAADTKVSANG